MGQPKKISKAIYDLEKILTIHKFVMEKFPDAKSHISPTYFGFSAKSVNYNYSNFEFIKGNHVLYVMPYLELDFNYNDKVEKIRINSSPRSNRLAYVKYSKEKKCNIIHFSKLKFNLKNHKFKADMINSCILNILSFIKEHPNHILDEKNLDPRLKNLLIFN